MSASIPQAASDSAGSDASSAAPALHPGDWSGPRFFGPSELRLFGWFHAGHPQRDAVLLCPPIGHEAEHTESSYRLLAERLASRGANVLRFHYHGTGDSAGTDRDPERVASWIASVHAALDELKQITGAARVSVFGTRLGATLALLAAESRDDVSAMLLVAPVVSGKRFARELRAIKLLWAQNHPEISYAPPSGGDDEAGGYRYTRRTLDAIQSLDATALARRPAQTVLVVPRDDLGSDDEALCAHLERLGTPCERLVLKGYSAMQRDMPAPSQLLDVIAAWFAPIPRAVPAQPARPAPETAPVAFAAEGPGSPLVTEVPLHLALARGHAFGVLTAPAGDARPDAPVLVIWGRRRGPNRLYVPLARALAARGALVVRLDLPGLGDAATPGDDERNDLYTTQALDAATEILARIRERMGERSIGIIGLCAGAYLAHQASQRDPRIRELSLINPPPLYWESWTPEAFFPRSNAIYWSYRYLTVHRGKAAQRPRSLLRLLRGARRRLTIANLSRLSRAVASRVSRPLARSARRLRLLPDTFGRMVQGLDRRGLQPLLVYSRKDPGLLALEERIRTGVERLPGHAAALVDADHILLSVASQERAREAIVAHMLRTMDPAWVVPERGIDPVSPRPASPRSAPVESLERANQRAVGAIRTT